MTVRWTVRAANDRRRDRAARLEPCLRRQKNHPTGWFFLLLYKKYITRFATIFRIDFRKILCYNAPKSTAIFGKKGILQ